METKQIQFQIKQVDETGTFEGYGSVFDVKDSYGEVVVKGAFSKTLETYKSKGRLPALLWQHNASEPIGVWQEMREDETGLYMKGKLLIDDDPLARRAYAHLKEGSISGLSIGFVPKVRETDEETGTIFIKEAELWETSIVTFPANDEARVSAVKSVDEVKTIRDFERFLRDAGFSKKAATALAAGGWPRLRDWDDQQKANDEFCHKVGELIQSLTKEVN